MSYYNAKYKNDYGEYEITFGSKERELTKVVEKVCQVIIDKKINVQNAAAVLDRLIKSVEAAPKVGEWIPCSEQMPPVNEKVLVTVDIEGELERSIADHSMGDWFFEDEYYSFTGKSFEVVAWMPLPEPYREDGESDG